MNISKHLITNTDQIKVGDAVVVVKSYHGRTSRVQYAEVTRKLKTKFELTFEDGRKVDYSTRIDFRSIKRYGVSDGYGLSSQYMYPVNDEVVEWCTQESHEAAAHQLRAQLAELTSNIRQNEVGTEESLNTAREIADLAQQLAELEEEISKIDHAVADREEREQ